MGLFAPSIDKLRAKGDVAGLLRAMDKNPRDAQACTDAIVALGPRATPQLLSLLCDDTLSTCAAVNLAVVGDDTLPPVLEMGRSDDRDLQAGALEALYYFALFRGTGDAFVEIRRLMRESRYAAVRSIAMSYSDDLDEKVMAHIQAATKAVDLLEAEEDPRRAYAMAEYLATKNTDPAWQRTLIRQLVARTPPASRWGSLALGLIGKPAVEPTIEAMESGQGGLCSALMMLGEDNPEALTAVERAAATHESEAIRAEAVQALQAKESADHIL